MDAFTTNDLKALLEEHEPPCLSIYLPTDRGFGEKNAVRWKNQLHAAERLLHKAGVGESVYRKRLAAAWKLQENTDFWRHQSDGFAWFQANSFNRFYRLPASFEEKMACARHFRLTPLLEMLGENGGFYVLAISQNRVRLLHGTRFGLEEVELTHMPTSLAEALKYHDRDESVEFHGLRPGSSDWGSIFHGVGGDFDQHKTDLLRYFQIVDRGLHEFLRGERAPLFLAGVEYLWPIYHEANTYPHLQKVGIPGNPEHAPAEKLHREALKLATPLFRQPRVDALAKYAQLAGTGRTSESLEEVLLAASQGKVDMLFLDRDAEWFGAFDPVMGAMTLCNPEPSNEEELLNLAAIYTLQHGGKVWMCPPRETPRGVPIAATLRAPLGLHRGRTMAGAGLRE